MIYLIVHSEGDVHKLNEAPTEKQLTYIDVTFIRINVVMKIEFYSHLAKDWVEVTE